MEVTRERFIDQFAISIGVHALKVWPRRSKEPPDHVGRAVYDIMTVCAGDIPVASVDFGRIVQPIIAELHRITPNGRRPDAHDLTGRVYDALSAAGIEVRIRPPIKSHGGAMGRTAPDREH